MYFNFLELLKYLSKHKVKDCEQIVPIKNLNLCYLVEKTGPSVTYAYWCL